MRRESQKELYRMFHAYGMSITLRYTDTRDDAVGVLNDSFVKVFHNIQKYDRNRPFKPWLRQIIVNTAIDHFHRQQKLQSEILSQEIMDNSASDETIISGISYDEIIGMIRKLSPAYRTVFNLHVIEGFTHEEIAEKLGISVGTSKSNLAKAKKNLQLILNKSF
jgi:RNA polymerase sigma factor (sigma-70 family)